MPKLDVFLWFTVKCYSIIISIESLTALVSKFTVCKKCYDEVKVIGDCSNCVGLARTFKIECN